MDVVSSIQRMGRFSEQSLLILEDIIVLELMEKTGVTAQKMIKCHRNVE